MNNLEIKTKNDAIKELIWKILEVSEVVKTSFTKSTVLGKVSEYDCLKEKIRENFKFDTTPYDNIVQKLTRYDIE